MRLKILTCFVFILLVHHGVGQTSVQGRVYDLTDSLYLPGVTILNLNTRDTIASNLEGNFSIKANIGDQLVFRFLGFVERTVIIQNFEFLEVGIKEWSTDHDFGWNRVYIGPNLDLTNQLIGGEIEYLSNPLIGYHFYLNPRFIFYSDQQVHVKDAILKIHSFIPRNDRTNASLYLRYRLVNFSNYEFENFTFSVLPRIKGFHVDVGLSTSRYSVETVGKNYLGFLIGFQEEIKIAGYYFPIEYNSVFWKGDIEFNARVTHRITSWLRAGISYQHYRKFDQLGINLSSSFRLWRRVKNEY